MQRGWLILMATKDNECTCHCHNEFDEVFICGDCNFADGKHK